MKKYEVGFIIKPTIDEAATKAVVTQLKNIYVDSDSIILDELELGLRPMAYEIEKHQNGFYYFMIVETTAEANKEFERICNISEDVIRYMFIDVDNVEANTLDVLRKK